MTKDLSVSSTFASLWFRLVSLGIVGCVFTEALVLAPGKVQGWTSYLTTWEVLFEVLIRAVFAALTGIVVGTIFTILVGPLLWYFKEFRHRVWQWTTNAFVVLVLFVDTRFALVALIKWSQRGVRFTTALLILHFLAFVVALCLQPARRELLASLEGFVGEKVSRVTVAAIVVIMIALAGTEYAFAHATSTVKAAQVAQRPKSNVLLVTFDALSAEDMSLYGYKLPTTPNLDAFAQRSTVFTNFYSVTTFTTPSIATMLTGRYPSETGVFHLQGRVQSTKEKKNLAQLLPEPTFQAGGLQRLWSLTAPFHQTSGIGSRVAEYIDLESAWNSLFSLPGNLSMRFRPDASFEQANHALDQLPDGFFLWVHLVAPHHPYLPDPEDRGRFLPADEGKKFEENSELQWVPHYAPDQQGKVDRRRLLYDEFVSSADRAFGAFIAELEKSGKLNDTTVIVSADHGESFEGGVFRHESPYLTRPTVHIPLIIHTPSQQQGRMVAWTADQTALAPTILDLAGQPKAGWMQGQYQYVLDLNAKKGALRPLSEAQNWDIDRTAENPAKAAELLAAIYARFPG